MRITVKDKSATTYSEVQPGQVFTTTDGHICLKINKGEGRGKNYAIGTGNYIILKDDEIVKLVTSMAVEVE